MAKKLSKILWYGAEKDALGKPVIPPLSPSVEKHLEGLNEGEIYIHNDDEYPALYIRTNKDKIVAIGGVDALIKFFIRKDKEDTAKEVITFEKGLKVGDFSTGSSGAALYKDLTTGHTIMELDKLYVRMKAYFETLTIIEAETIAGKQIISPAGSVRCTNVEEYDDYYRCYFLNEQDGEKIENKFIEGDQVYSQMFNAKTGTSNKISNRYYWRLVTGVGEDYIDLSKTDCDADSDIPMVGDVLNHRGHRYAENSERMNFIETSTVDGFSPSITLFHGVNSFSLAGKDYVQFGVDKTTNKAFMNVYGDMYVGDRNKTAYMRYTQEEGLVICGKLDVGTKLGDSYLKDLISASTPEGYQEFVEKVTQDLEGLQAQIDGTIDSYFFQYEPSLNNYPASDWDTENEKKAHLNDTFTNLVDGRSWRWSLDGTYKWIEITDTATTKALALAGKAQDTADGKRRVFVDTPYPPYDKGDLWSRGSNYPLMICVVPKESGVYADGDFDYADNNSKLKQEMQTLVTDTKDELNNAIGQAKNEAVTNANKYTDEGKSALQESINALERAKANITDVYTQAQADKKISESEERALKAAEEEADAAIAYYDTIVKAYADGVATEEELAVIAGAKAALDAAKKYAEEQAQAAKSEIENSYLFQALQDAQSTEIANGLVLTSLIQLRDTQSNIMSGINGLINASKGDKSIATWWGGDMLDLIDYYRWDGTQWVVKSGITAPSNIPSGLIRMDGTGYLAKGKFWWDNEGKIYADPTALFLSFDVNAEEGTLSATILDIRDKQTEFANMWTEKTDSNGTKYLYTTYPLVTQGGVTMYAGTSGLDVEGIYDGLPIDGKTIYWDNGVLKAVGGGGTADAVAWENITGKPSFATVATSGSYNDLLNKPTLLSSFTNDVGYLTEHQDLSGYQTKITSSAKLAASLVSGLATVATSGSYNDLSNKPTIPTSLKNPYALSWSGYSSGSYDGSAAKSITIPTNTNQLTNGAGFITSSGSITGSSKILKFQNLISSSTINIWNGGYNTLQIHEVSQGKDVPTNYPFGYLHNYRWASTQWSNQLYFSVSDYESRLFTRGYRDDTDTWTSWNTVAFLSDIDSKLSGYLPLSGGTITGGSGVYSPLIVKNSSSEVWIQFQDSVGSAYIGTNRGVPSVYLGSGSNMPILHSGNYSSYALPLTGGTIKGTISIPLAINTTAKNEVGLQFKMSGVNKGWVGYTPNIGIYLYSYGTSGVTHKLGISDSGAGLIDSYALYHSGNLTKLSQLTNDSGFITSSASISGNAATATKLATARTIWGQSFDGSSDISGDFTSGYIHIHRSNEINSYVSALTDNIALHLQFRVPGNVSLCAGGGNVGIGTTSPSYKLDVNGTVRVGNNVANGVLLKFNMDRAWHFYQEGSGSTSALVLQSGTSGKYFHIKNDSGSNIASFFASSESGNRVGVNGVFEATTIYQNGSSLDSLLGAKLNSSSYTAADVLAKLKTVDGSGSGLDADTLDGVHLMNWKGYQGIPRSCGNSTFTTVNQYFGNGNIVVFDPLPTDANDNDLGANTVIVSYGENAHRNHQLAYSIYQNHNPKYRRNVDGTWSKWKTFAFTSDNVASATKLQTARTIWGQSFDGSGNVDGTLRVNAVSGNYTQGIRVYQNGTGYANLILGSATLTAKDGTDSNTWCLTTSSKADFVVARGGYRLTDTISFGYNGNWLINGGNVGIGTTSPSYKLDVNGSFRTSSLTFTSSNTISFDDNGNIKLSSNSGAYWHVDTSDGSNVLTAHSNGNVGIGTISPSYKLHVAGTAYISSNLLTGGGITMYSARVLKNVVDERGLSLRELSVIKPTRYTWKDKRDERLHIGGIADDIQQVLPEVVYRTPDGVLTMDYGNAAFAIASSLIKPMIEHESEIVSLKRKVLELEEEVKRLRA